MHDKQKSVLTLKEVEFFTKKTIKELRKMDEFIIGQIHFFSNSHKIKKLGFLEEERNKMTSAQHITIESYKNSKIEINRTIV